MLKLKVSSCKILHSSPKANPFSLVEGRSFAGVCNHTLGAPSAHWSKAMQHSRPFLLPAASPPGFPGLPYSGLVSSHQGRVSLILNRNSRFIWPFFFTGSRLTPHSHLGTFAHNSIPYL